MADLVRGLVARLLREEIRDPRIGFVTITDVRMSHDLKHARVYFSVLGGAEAREEAGKALSHAAPFLRRALARESGLRHAPEIYFEEDASLDSGFRVDALLREISEKHGDGGGDRGQEPEDEQ